MELSLFDQVDDLVRAMTPEELGALRTRAHRRGIKLWFEAEKSPPVHYEAQLLSRKYVDKGEGSAIEVGLHAEYGDEDANEHVLQQLAASERSWLGALGDQATAGTFFGADHWRRISEVWLEPATDDPEFALAIAARIVDYVEALEPLLRDIPSE